MKLKLLNKLLVAALRSDDEKRQVEALKAINKWLAREGRDAHWLADRLTQAPEPFPAQRPSADSPVAAMADWREMLAYCANHNTELNPWEFEFIRDMCRRATRWPKADPTPGQLRVVIRIYQKLQLAERVWSSNPFPT